MAGNIRADNNGDIYVEFDYNNIIVVDPNKTIDDFGNVNETKLEKIWQGTMYKNLQKNYLNYNLCKTCNMRKPLVNQVN